MVVAKTYVFTKAGRTSVFPAVYGRLSWDHKISLSKTGLGPSAPFPEVNPLGESGLVESLSGHPGVLLLPPPESHPGPRSDGNADQASESA